MSTTHPKDTAVRWKSFFENNWREVRYACRSLARNPGFTATAILILALGIGMTTCVFSVAESLLSRPLPVRDPRALVLFRAVNPVQEDHGDRVPDELFHLLTDASTALSRVFGLLPAHQERTLLESDTARDYVQVHMVTADYFPVLGVSPVAGRMLANSDEEARAPAVAVISHRLWQRHFNGDPDAVGKTIRLSQPFVGINRPDVTVVGIAPPDFYGVDVDADPDVWVPFQVLNLRTAYSNGLELGGPAGLRVMARTRQGVRLEEVQAEIDVLARQVAQPGFAADEFGRLNVRVEPGGRGYSRLRDEFSEPVMALSAAVGVVLIIVWTNLAALMLGRGVARGDEMAVRLALGCNRKKLLGVFLWEGTILALAGGSLGFVFAFWGTEALTSWFPPESSLMTQVRPDGRALVFSAVVSLLGVIVFAFLPGIRASDTAIARPLSSAAGGLGRRGTFVSGHRITVVAQLALSLALLIGAGLFLRTFANLLRADTGFEEQGVMQFEIESPDPRRLRDFAEAGLSRLANSAGVLSTTYYGQQGLFTEEIAAVMLSVNPGGQIVRGSLVYTGPRFFETLAIPFLAGRTFGGGSAEPRVVIQNEEGIEIPSGEVILSQSLADALFEGDDPIGRSLFWESEEEGLEGEGRVLMTWEVVGIVGDVQHRNLREQSDRTLYLFSLQPRRFAVRTEGDAFSLAPIIRRIVDEFDSEFRITEMRTLAQLRSASLAPERFVAQMTTFFGLVSLVLASIGTYGVFSYAATLRRSELGIRMALGAKPGSVLTMFMRETIWVLGPGVALGLLAALTTTRLLESMLFGVKPADPVSIIVATVVLGATAAFAAYIPARRASRLDPMVTLRE